MLGPIRQELLSGIKDQTQFKLLKEILSYYDDYPIKTKDYELAAEFFNTCRSKGIQGSNTDFLICAVSKSNRFPIFTIDKDFEKFAKYIQITLLKVYLTIKLICFTYKTHYPLFFLFHFYQLKIKFSLLL